MVPVLLPSHSHESDGPGLDASVGLIVADISIVAGEVLQGAGTDGAIRSEENKAVFAAGEKERVL